MKCQQGHERWQKTQQARGFYFHVFSMWMVDGHIHIHTHNTHTYTTHTHTQHTQREKKRKRLQEGFKRCKGARELARKLKAKPESTKNTCKQLKGKTPATAHTANEALLRTSRQKKKT